MPELPDIVTYLDALDARILGQQLERIQILSPFLLRSVAPAISAAEGKRVVSLERLGKRIVIGLAGDLFLVLHLMIAGRLRWSDEAGKAPGRIGLAVFKFSSGTLVLTEAGTKRRASLHLVQGRDQLAPFDFGGLDVMQADLPTFAQRLSAENHTLKRSLTDPRTFNGIGNAYSDEILHRAQLSPIAMTKQLTAAEIERLYNACRAVLTEWIVQLKNDANGKFPVKVTAFREGMAVHGRFRKPCPVCGSPVQRIVYAENETNYCARCQTGGRILADRSLSRLLKKSWPRNIDDLE
ncbi:MAG: DNA-formamidopyrimidine glycosylase family protein [Betaproteobacteria bacterium]